MQNLKKWTPKYKFLQADIDLGIIKKDDTLIFDLSDKELQDKKIYLLKMNLGYKEILLYSEYKKDINCFVRENNGESFYLKVEDDDVEIMGKLIKYQREFDI